MENKELVDSLLQTHSYSTYAGDLHSLANKAGITRTDILGWLAENVERFLSDREERPLFAKWVDTHLSPNEKQDLHIIINPYEEKATADGRRWYYLIYGMNEPQINHQPGVIASYYGKSQVESVDTANERIDVYDVVRVSGQHAKEVNYHEYAKEKDTRPFYVDAAYVQDSETVAQWDTYKTEGNLDALLCEADWATNGFEDTAELKYVSHTPAGSNFSSTLCENNALVVVKEPFDAYAVSVKANSNQILDWWYNGMDKYEDMHEDVQQLIREDTLRSFECYPHKSIPLPNIEGHVAYYQPETDELVIHPFGPDGLNDILIPYDHNLRSIDKNIERGVQALQEQGINKECLTNWRRENGFSW